MWLLSQCWHAGTWHRFKFHTGTYFVILNFVKRYIEVSKYVSVLPNQLKTKTLIYILRTIKGSMKPLP